MTKKIRNYGTKYKAVKNISDDNGNISAIAKQLGLVMQTLSSWHNKANGGKLVGTEQYDPELIAVSCAHSETKIQKGLGYRSLICVIKISQV